MGKRITRVEVQLDSKGIKTLPLAEIKAILRGADDLIMSGGRNLLAKILKGSKDKKVIELKLDHSPVYGYFKEESIDTITAKIDWLILNHYLAIEYDYRLPLLVFAPKGWQIEMDTRTDEFIQEFDAMLNEGRSSFDMTYLKDRDRNMILLLLDKLKATKDKRYIPILKAWYEIDYNKVRQRINSVIQALNDGK
ncbi:MAG TPA: RQC-minor-1 family DNA-binding protein [bacterium]|nr:RQC-minor-1 family DNA-binding protein [bacterium]HPN45690.1 RQC-minor-1 family DNA-binding protein [bacterium]